MKKKIQALYTGLKITLCKFPRNTLYTLWYRFRSIFSVCCSFCLVFSRAWTQNNHNNMCTTRINCDGTMVFLIPIKVSSYVQTYTQHAHAYTFLLFVVRIYRVHDGTRTITYIFNANNYFTTYSRTINP